MNKPQFRASRQKVNGITLGFMGLCLVAAAIIGFSGSFNGKPKPDSSVTTNTQSTSAPVSTTTTADKVTTWYDQYGSVFQTLENDFKQMSTDASNSDIAAVQSDCQQINTDVKTAQAYPAIPDAQSASDFGGALSYYESGSRDCVNAIDNNDTNGISQASAELSQGTAKITATTNDIASLK